MFGIGGIHYRAKEFESSQTAITPAPVDVPRALAVCGAPSVVYTDTTRHFFGRRVDDVFKVF